MKQKERFDEKPKQEHEVRSGRTEYGTVSPCAAV